MGRAYSTHRRGEKCIQTSFGKSGGKRPLRKHRHRWKIILE